MKQDRESKEGKALVSSKALEFKENVKALRDLETCLKLKMIQTCGRIPRLKDQNL